MSGDIEDGANMLVKNLALLGSGTGYVSEKPGTIDEWGLSRNMLVRNWELLGIRRVTGYVSEKPGTITDGSY